MFQLEDKAVCYNSYVRSADSATSNPNLVPEKSIINKDTCDLLSSDFMQPKYKKDPNIHIDNEEIGQSPEVWLKFLNSV